MKVLIVDDDQNLGHSLRRAMESYGFLVAACINAEEALRRAEKECFDVIVTDCDMPGMNGLELAKGLRRQCPGAVIVGMSGREAHDAFRSAGADHFFLKPFTIEQLLQILVSGPPDG